MAGSAIIGALRVTLSIDTAEFREGVEKARLSLAEAGKTLQGVGKTMSLAVTAPLAGLAAVTLKTAGDFEAAMNRVQAASSASGDEMKAMQALALKLGADTSKSATEAADGMEMLAKNGVSAKDILNGAADASIKLSVATGSDLSKAADVATNVMAQFGAKSQDLGKIVDHITGVTLQSQFGFEDYALAIGQAGGVAGALGVSIDDFNAALTATSSVFASGSDAGTSFKNFLTSLNPQSKQAGEAMKQLGLEFYTTDGSMKSMAQIAEVLKTKMGNLSQQDLSDKMKTIFGVDGMRTAIALMQQGGDGVEAMNAKIQAASADEQAAARMKGFNGQLEQMKGAFESLEIAIANSGLLAFMTELVAKLADVLTWLGQTNPQILKWGTIIAGVAVALGPVITAIGFFAAALAAAPITVTVASVAALTAAVIAFSPQIQVAASAVASFVSGAWAAFVSSLEAVPQKFTAVKDACVQFAADIVAAFAALPGQMIAIGGQIIDGLWQGIKNKAEAAKQGIADVASGIKDRVTSFFDIHSPSRVMQTVGENIVQGLANGIGGMQSSVAGTATKVASTVKRSFDEMTEVGKTLKQGMSDVFHGLIEGGGAAETAIKGLLVKLGDVALNSGLDALSKAFGGGGASGSSGPNLFSAIGSGLKSLFGFANGGSILPGGSGAGIDSQVVAFRKSPTERVDIYDPRKINNRGNDGGSRGGDIINNIAGDVSEKTLKAMNDQIRANNRQLSYARDNDWRNA